MHASARTLPWMELWLGWNSTPAGTLLWLEFCPAGTLSRPEPCPWQRSNRAEFQPRQSSNWGRVPARAEFQPRHACEGKVPAGTLRRHLFDGIMEMLEFLFCQFLLGIWLIFLVRWSFSCFTYMVVWNLVHGPWTLEASMKAYSPWSSTWGYFVRHIIMIPQEVPLWNWNLNVVPYFSRLCLGGLRRCLHDCLYEYS